MNEVVIHVVSRDETAKGFGSAERRSRGFGSAIGGIAKGAALGLAGVGVAATVMGGRFVKAAEESQRVSRQTQAVIKSTGGVARVSAKDVEGLARALSKKSGVDDEIIASGENVLLTFTNVRNEVGKGNDIFNQATTVALDMSRALGQDMQSSVIQLGKALNDPIKGLTSLQRVGVTFNDQQREQIKTLVESGDKLGAQKVILAELNKEFAGSAEAQATASDKMAVAWGNAEEALGTALLPLVERFSDWMVNVGAPAIQNHLVPAIDEYFVPALGRVAGAVEEVALPKLRDLYDMVHNKVIPEVQRFGQTVHDEWLPALKRLGGSADEQIEKLGVGFPVAALLGGAAGVGMFKLIEEGMSHFGLSWNEIWGRAQQIFWDVVGRLHTKWEAFKFHFGNIVEEIKLRWNEGVAWIREKWGVATTWLGEKFGYVKLVAGVVFEPFISGAKRAIGWIADLIGWIDSAVSKMGRIIAGGPIGGAVAGGVSGATTGVIDPKRIAKAGRKASGGIAGAMAGGIRSNLTWVGEHEAELIELPAGTRVHSGADSRRIAAQGGSPVVVNLVYQGDGSDLDRALFEHFRERIRDGYGGDVQAALGYAS